MVRLHACIKAGMGAGISFEPPFCNKIWCSSTEALAVTFTSMQEPSVKHFSPIIMLHTMAVKCGDLRPPCIFPMKLTSFIVSLKSVIPFAYVIVYFSITLILVRSASSYFIRSINFLSRVCFYSLHIITMAIFVVIINFL